MNGGDCGDHTTFGRFTPARRQWAGATSGLLPNAPILIWVRSPGRQLRLANRAFLPKSLPAADMFHKNRVGHLLVASRKLQVCSTRFGGRRSFRRSPLFLCAKHEVVVILFHQRLLRPHSFRVSVQLKPCTDILHGSSRVGDLSKVILPIILGLPAILLSTGLRVPALTEQAGGNLRPNRSDKARLP